MSVPYHIRMVLYLELGNQSPTILSVPSIESTPGLSLPIADRVAVAKNRPVIAKHAEIVLEWIRPIIVEPFP